jgi:hypothetical protein
VVGSHSIFCLHVTVSHKRCCGFPVLKEVNGDVKFGVSAIGMHKQCLHKSLHNIKVQIKTIKNWCGSQQFVQSIAVQGVAVAVYIEVTDPRVVSRSPDLL